MKRRTILTFATAAVIAGLPLGYAAPAAAAPSVDKGVNVPSSAALRLANAIGSDDIVREQTERVLQSQMPKTLNADPNFQKLEHRWPGFTAEFIKTIEPIALATALKQAPDHRRQVAALFDRTMTPGDISALLEFFGSPTGVKMVAALVHGMDYSAILQKQIATGGKATIESADVRATAESAVSGAMAQFTPGEQEEIEAFGTSPAGAKFAAVTPRMAALGAAFNNEKDPAAEAEVKAATVALVQRHLAEDKEKTP